MAIYQVLVKLLDGTTRCLQILSPTISGEALKLNLLTLTGIPTSAQRLVTGSLSISNDTVISASADNLFPSCTLLLRLPGGKGGFGSLLRGAATKAGQKKTNNFDACRDMSGRRLRHVNAEKRLEEWKAEAEDRKLEQLAEQFLKKKAKEVKKNSSANVEKYLDKYRADAAKCMEVVEESVRESFELYRENKRKALPSSDPSKRMKIWLGKNKVDDSDSEDDDEDVDEEKSVVLDDGNCSKHSSGEEGTSASGAVSGAHSDGESSGRDSDRSNLEGVIGFSDVGSSPVGDGSGSVDGNSESGDSVEAVMGASNETGAQGFMFPSLKAVPELDESAVGPGLEVVKKSDESDQNLEEVKVSDQPELAKEKPFEPELVTKEPVAQTPGVSEVEEPLNFDFYNSAAELEVLGMDRLKLELQTHGLKCGGTLQERAARLFLLKTNPLEKLPKKLLAKPVGGGK